MSASLFPRPKIVLLRLLDDCLYQLQQIFPSTREWNFLVFSGNIIDEFQKHQVKNLATILFSPKYVVQKIRYRGQPNILVGALSIYSSFGISNRGRHMESTGDSPASG